MASTGSQRLAEFSEQIDPRVLRDMKLREKLQDMKNVLLDKKEMKPNTKPKHTSEVTRLQHSWVASAEKRALVWLAARTPEWIGPDHLTVLGLAAQIGAGVCYALARYDRRALLAVIACLALNWLGDSLDGTLARVRGKLRPRYGFYVDHMVDSVGALALMGGLAVSGYMHPVIAIGLLIAFLMLSIQSYLATHTLGEFRLSFWRFGPTELRILLALGNLALFWKPMVHLFWLNKFGGGGDGPYRLFDIGGTIGLAGMGLILICFTLQNTARLYREERISQ